MAVFDNGEFSNGEGGPVFQTDVVQIASFPVVEAMVVAVLQADRCEALRPRLNITNNSTMSTLFRRVSLLLSQS